MEKIKISDKIKLVHGNCLEVLKQIPDNYFDSIVTDPPYGLTDDINVIEVMKCWLNGTEYKHPKKGFMGKDWDSFVPDPITWREVFRVLKPGGHLISFGGTRTYDLMALSVRIAGFEIRDQMQWLYGCYSEDTECLTKLGWKKYTDLSKEDEVLQWDKESNSLTWIRPKNIFIYEHSGEMVHLKNRHSEQLITPNHKVFAKIRKHARNPKPENFEIIEAGEIKNHWQIDLPMAGTLNDGTEFDLDLAYMIGWWLTDAYIHNDEKSCMFTQCKLDTLEKLKNGLSKMDCTFEEYIRKPKKENHKPEHVFYVTGNLSNYLLINYPNREMSWKFMNWNIEARTKLVEGLMDADGSSPKDEYNRTFWSKKKERLDIFNALILSLNYRSYVDYKKGAVYFNIKTNTTQIQSKHIIEKIEYVGKVWCLETDTGAFVVRRNGKAFISGNSGFPKSLNVGKSMEEKFGKSDLSDYHQSTGTALKPANEPILLARKPLSEKTVAENVLKWGVGGLNIDGSRIQNFDKSTARQRNISIKGGNLISREFVTDGILAGGHAGGRWPANIINSCSCERMKLKNDVPSHIKEEIFKYYAQNPEH